MELTPHDWNVVVVGFWNRAIYTPQGIAQRLLQVTSGEEVGVELPFDTIAPFRVSFGKHVVIVDGGRLIIELAEHTLEYLVGAMSIAVRAMEDLPKTPVKAAGINVRHSAEGSALEELTTLREPLQLQWDKRIQEFGASVSHRSVSRKFPWREGVTQITVTEDDDKIDVLLNFEKTGEVTELIDWLRMPISEIRDHVSQVHEAILGLEPPFK